MRILLFSVYYSPDGGPAAALFTMLSEALVQRGHIVTVITTVPHYSFGGVPVAYRGWSIRKSMEKGVYVIRLPMPSVNWESFIARFIQLIIYQILATLYSLKVDFDIVLTYTAAFGIWLPFTWSSFLRHKPVVYSIHDIYPDVGIKLGIFKNKFTINVITWLEKYCLSHARIIRVLSDFFVTPIKSLGAAESRIRIIYDWVEVDEIGLFPRNNSFSSQYCINDTFNVVYAGNLGIVQGLETVIQSAAILQQEKQIKFIFIGEGIAKLDLIEKTTQKGLLNVIFIPYQSRDRMSEVWASADVALVVLHKGTGIGALPSKTFSIMASGRPILVSVDEESETSKLVKRADAGLCVPPEDPSKLAEAVLTLKEDKNLRERLGHNGRVWAEQHHSPEYAAEQFEKILFEAINSSNNPHRS